MSDIEKPIQVFPGYEQLANVLQDALDQAQAGKGSQRHANGKPFMEQPIITDGRACGLAGPAFQARKKILEALRCPDEERAVQDLLGAIVYTAAMVILKEEERQKREECPMVDAETTPRWRMSPRTKHQGPPCPSVVSAVPVMTTETRSPSTHGRCTNGMTPI